MDDTDILDKLIEQAGGVKSCAEAMNVSRQSIWEWRQGLSDKARIRIYLYAEKVGVRLPRDFLRRSIA